MLKEGILGPLVVKGDMSKKGSLVSIIGRSGSMKTTLAHTIVETYLESKAGKNAEALFITLEETMEDMVESLTGLNVPVTGRTEIVDFTRFREKALDLGVLKKGDKIPDNAAIVRHAIGYQKILDIIFETIEDHKEKHGDKMQIVVLDSLGAIQSLMADSEKLDPRQEMFYFFRDLRKRAPYTFIIMESTGDTKKDSELFGNAKYLNDGNITVNWKEHGDEVRRYIVLEGMRNMKVKGGEYEFVADPAENGIKLFTEAPLHMR